MVRLIPLEKTANQKLNVQLNGVSYNVFIKTRGNLTYLSLEDGENPIVYGRLCLPNEKIQIPPYLFKGALFFYCQDNETPYYEQFGGLHNLYYLDEDELESIKNGN